MVTASSTQSGGDALSTHRDVTVCHRCPTLGRILAGDSVGTWAGHVLPYHPVTASPKKQLPRNRPHGFGSETLFIYPVRRWQPWKVPRHQGRALNAPFFGRAVPVTPAPARDSRAQGPGQSPALSSPAHPRPVPQFPFPVCVLHAPRAEPCEALSPASIPPASVCARPGPPTLPHPHLCTSSG